MIRCGLGGRLGLHGSEAVGAEDRAVHVRLEWNLGLITAARADDSEVLARTPVSTRLARSLTGISHGSTGRPAARAAFRVRHEPFLGVELLILGRVHKLGTAVNTGEGSIDVGHVHPPGAAACEPTVPGRANRIEARPQPGTRWEAWRIGRNLFGYSCLFGTHRRWRRVSRKVAATEWASRIAEQAKTTYPPTRSTSLREAPRNLAQSLRRTGPGHSGGMAGPGVAI